MNRALPAVLRRAHWPRIALPLAVGLLAPGIAAQQSGPTTPVRLRVTTSRAAGEATIDRGTFDKVQVGDVVELRPRGGAVYRGVVADVTERASLVRLDDRTFRPGPGTRGEVLVPTVRLQPAAKDPAAPPPKTPVAVAPPERQAAVGRQDPAVPPAERPPWPERDDGFKQGMPLLAGVKPQRPDDRPMRISGSMYSLGLLGRDFEGRSQESFLRTGLAVDVENPAGRGGRFRFDGEGVWLTETNEQTGVDLMVREVSYAWGGDRFSPNGFEVGRFLQGGMPEFGILDGAQWSRRLNDQWQVTASAGFLPEAGEDMDSGEDLQFATHALWSRDSSQRLTFGFGYQKTFHNGKTDRDLIALRGDWRGDEGWSSHARASVDIYQGRDDIKGSGLGLTHAWWSVGRTDAEGGVEWSWRHQEFPELLRQGEFLPVLAIELSRNRYDRLAWNGWSAWGDRGRVRGHVSFYNDEDDSGGAAEFGVGGMGAFGVHGHTEMVLFGALAQFTDDLGVRINHWRQSGPWRYDGLYEFGYHHLVDYPSDGDSLFQHRVRGGVAYSTTGGWDGSLFSELVFQDGETSWNLGFYFQRGF